MGVFLVKNSNVLANTQEKIADYIFGEEDIFSALAEIENISVSIQQKILKKSKYYDSLVLLAKNEKTDISILKELSLNDDIEVKTTALQTLYAILCPLSLKEYINKYYAGSQSAFAIACNKKPQQITQWINKDFIVIDNSLYSKRSELPKVKN